MLLRYESLTYEGYISYEFELTYSTDCVTDEDIKINEDLTKYNLNRDSYSDYYKKDIENLYLNEKEKNRQ